MSLLSAAFLDPGFGARPAGMGDAFAGLADDANAVLYNPAGATQAGSRQVALTYVKPFAGLDDVSLGANALLAVLPVSDAGAAGFAWTDLNGPASSHDSIALSAATSLNRWFPKLAPSVSIGANYRYHRQTFDLDARTRGDSVFAGGRSAGASGYDLSVWMRPDPRLLPGLSFGFVGKSLNEPDIGLAARDEIPREFVAGAAYSFRRATLLLDVARRRDATEWRAGAEAWYRDETLGLRAGANPRGASTGFTYLFRTSERIGLFLDYAFTLPLEIEDTAGSHRAALGVLF